MNYLSKIFQPNDVAISSFNAVLHPLNEASACPKQKRRSASCSLCDYIRENYPEVNSGEEVEALIEKTLKEAYDIGYNQGLQQVTEMLQQQHTQEMEQVEQAVQLFANNVTTALDEYYINLEKQFKEITMSIAEKIVRKELAIEPDTVLLIIKDALKRVATSINVRVLVNEADFKIASDSSDELLSILKNVKIFEVSKDPRVTSGGVIIETESGFVDSRIDSQLLEIKSNIEKTA